jgi:hypothetical protein
VRDRQAEQRAALAAREPRVGVARLRERRLGPHVDERVQGASPDPFEVMGGELPGTRLAAVERPAQRRQRLQVPVGATHSITRGTRYRP